MVGAILSAWRRLRLSLWAAKVRLRLRRLGMRATVEIAPGVRYDTLPLLEVHAHSPATGGGTLRISFARDVRLGRDLVVDVMLGGDNVLVIGERTVVSAWCRYQLQGGSIAIGRDTHVRDLVLLKAKSAIRIGARNIVGRGSSIQATTGILIGDDSALGEHVTLIDSDHTFDGSGGAFLQAPLRTAPITIGRGVSVSANCVLLRGARMGDGSVLAANAVLTGEVPEGHLAGGLPARVLKDLRS